MPIENLQPWLITKLRKIVALGRAEQVKLALKCFAFPADLFLQRAAGGTHGCGNPHSGTGLDTHSMPTHISPFVLVMNAMSFISCHSPSQWSHISLLFLEQATGLLLTLEPLNCYGMFSLLPLSLPSFFFFKSYSPRNHSSASQIQLHLLFSFSICSSSQSS